MSLTNIKRDKQRDLEQTNRLITNIEHGTMPAITDQLIEKQLDPAISILRKHPYMLEFQQLGSLGFNGHDSRETQIVVHSPVDYLAQSLNKEKVCSDTAWVVELVKTCYPTINVITSNNVRKMCDGPNENTTERKYNTQSPFSLHGLGGGSKSRRTRRRKHSRKSHHKHARKTRHKRAHHSRSRSRAARKHKRYTYRSRK